MGLTRRGALALGAVLAGLLEAGCLVQIDQVADPTPAFARERLEAERWTSRPGRATELNVLVFSPDDRKMVRVRMPLWLARKLEARINRDDDDGGRGDDAARRLVRRHVVLKELERAGRGILV